MEKGLFYRDFFLLIPDMVVIKMEKNLKKIDKYGIHLNMSNHTRWPSVHLCVQFKKVHFKKEKSRFQSSPLDDEPPQL